MLNPTQKLFEQVEAIAEAWYQALNGAQDLPQPTEYLQSGLLQITSQIVALLSPETYRAGEARTIGARLALLGYKWVDVVAVLQPILVQRYIQGIDHPVDSTHPVMGRVWIDLTTGFLDHHHGKQLIEQEQALQAYESEWKRFITDRQETEQKSQAILSALPDSVSIITLDGVLLYYHSGSDQRYTNEEVAPFKNIRSYLPEALATELLTIYFGVIETGQPCTHEYSLTLQNGERHHYQDSVTPYLRNSVLVISRDNTQRRQIEAELHASQVRYRNVVEDQIELIARWRPDGTLIFINSAICSFTGKSYEQLIDTNFNEILKPATELEAQNLYSAIGALTPENPITQGQSQIRVNNHEPRWLEWKTRAFFNEDGSILEFQTTANDITEIKRIQDELRDSEARYRSVVETQNEIIIRFIPDGTITFVNLAVERVLGIPSSSLLEHNIVEFAPDLAQALKDSHPSEWAISTENPSITQELMIRTPDGRCLQLEISTQAIFNSRGEITEYQSSGRDVTELRQMEAALREGEARYRSVVEGQTELIIRYLPDGTVTFVNDALCSFFSKTQEELIGNSSLVLIYKEDLPASEEILAEYSNLTPENPIMNGQTRVAISEDELRWIEWTTRAMFRPDGTPEEFQSVGRDITALKLAQEALLNQNELLLQLGEQLINVQENERQRIALDLHDSVLNELGAMLIAPPEMLTPKIVLENYERLINRLRDTINDLRSPMLNYGLYPALEDLVDNYLDHPQASSAVSMDISASQARFDTQVELHLFRIIQQACDNALQHARARSVHLYGQIDEKMVALTVVDDGIGFVLDQESAITQILAKKHFGLISMIERGKLIGADVKISSNPGAGTTVSVLWEPVYPWT